MVARMSFPRRGLRLRACARAASERGVKAGMVGVGPGSVSSILYLRSIPAPSKRERTFKTSMAAASLSLPRGLQVHDPARCSHIVPAMVAREWRP